MAFYRSLKGATMNVSIEEYLSEICGKQERIIRRLEWLCVLTVGVIVALVTS